MSKDLLSKYTTIFSNIYATDNAYRLLTYTIAIYLTTASKSTFTDWLVDFKGKLSEARFINRLLIGLPASVEGYLAYGESTSNEAILGKIMAVSMILYHPLEHVWWASTLNTKLFNIDGNKWSQWSCRCWVIYVFCDMIGTVRRLIELEKVEDLKGAKDRRNLLIWLSCIFADAPLAIHWSMDNGPFSDSVLNWAGWYGGLAGLYLRYLKLRG